MCGICGWLNFSAENRVDAELLTKMTRTLAHRGPDGEGIYCKQNLGLGHRRLSIIDLELGKQPLANGDQSVWISFNGEIYNYLELMGELKQKGYVFQTNSDTEVLVHLYEEYQEEMFAQLRGMFAFAIWDSNRKKLVVARDRLGKKPLFYSHLEGNCFIFGSEIKAVTASGMCSQQLNCSALDNYLSYLYVPTPETIYKDIKKLPGGHYIVVADGRVTVKQYWDIKYSDHQAAVQSDQEYIEEFEEIFREAVKIRLRSDVPLGAFLSGGIDSSAVVGLMSELSDSRIETVSVGFREKEYNELEYAKEVARIFNCSYNEFMVEARPGQAVELIDRLLGFFDEPYADPSFIPTYFVAKAAREKVTVALSGDGGDESMAGYARHSIALLEAKLRRYSRFVPSLLLKKMYDILPRGTKGKNILGNLAESPAEAAARKYSNLLFTRELKEKVYCDEAMITDGAARFRQLYRQAKATHFLDKSLYLDIKTYLADDILVKVDRMSMAVGLEVRAPLLDHKLLEFLATVPPHLKLRNGTTKYILKELLAKRVPENLLNRKKSGFRLPIEVWLKKELRFLIEDMLHDHRFKERGIFNVREVESMWSHFISGKQDYAHLFWQILILELWFRKFKISL